MPQNRIQQQNVNPFASIPEDQLTDDWKLLKESIGTGNMDHSGKLGPSAHDGS